MEQTAQIVEKKEHKPRKTKRAVYVTFELAYDNIATFRELLKVLDDAFTDEVPLQIHQDGLAITVMDTSRVQMANYFISKTAFEEWLVSNNTRYNMATLPVDVTVPLKEVLYAIEKAGKDAKVRFEIKVVYSTVGVNTVAKARKPEKCPKCGKETLHNQLPSEKRGKKGNRYKCECGWRGKVRTWTKKTKVYETEIEDKESQFTVTVKEKTVETWDVKLLEQRSEEKVPLPLIRFNAMYKLVASDFRDIIERIKKRTDAVRFVGSANDLTLKGYSDYISGNVKIAKGSDIMLDVECRGEEKALYSIANLLSILPKKTVSEIMTLEFSTDMPTRITAYTNLGNSKIEYYLAPRIETE
jgi:DNA polymerase III sliding clamp (beta) subunit (PCNA family)